MVARRALREDAQILIPRQRIRPSRKEILLRHQTALLRRAAKNPCLVRRVWPQSMCSNSSYSCAPESPAFVFTKPGQLQLDEPSVVSTVMGVMRT
jgi:hypothetical protein